MQEQKRGGLLDQDRLNKIISDSQWRRNRQQRNESRTTGTSQNKHKIGQKDFKSPYQKPLQIAQSQGVLPSADDDQNALNNYQVKSQQLFTDINSQNSQAQSFKVDNDYYATNLSSQKPNNTSAIKPKKNITSNKKSTSTSVNFIERNKQGMEALRVAKQQQLLNQQTLQVKTQDTQLNTSNKNVSAKVNTRISRSKSAIGRTKKQPTITSEKAYRLDMSPEERIQDDLRRKITEETKTEIKGFVDDKYAVLEKMLQQNLGNISEIIQEGSPLKREIKEHSKDIMDLQFQTLNSEISKEQQVRPKTVVAQKVERKKSQPPVSRLFDPSQTQTINRTPKAGATNTNFNKVQTSKNGNFAGQQVLLNKTSDVQKKVQQGIKKSIQPLNSAYTPNKDTKIQTKSSVTPVSNKKMVPMVPKLNLGKTSSSKKQNQTTITQVKPLKSTDQTRGFIECEAVEKEDLKVHIRNQSPELQQVPPDDELDLKSSGVRSTNQVDYKLNSKEDYLNFSIEQIWKEMEEIGRSKRAAQDLFQAFQNQYYDRDASNYYNQDDCSPTKRLISMKNATTKHHTIEHRQGLKADGKYSLQYTTCPEKSYVVKPDNGKINYDEFKDKHAHKFVEKIINDKVEKIEIIEARSQSPVRKSITSKSPVKIVKESVKRGSLVRNSVITNNVNLRLEDNFSQEVADQHAILKAQINLQDQSSILESQVQDSIIQELNDDGPEIQINLDTEDYVESEDGYPAAHQNQNQKSSKILIEGRK